MTSLVANNPCTPLLYVANLLAWWGLHNVLWEVTASFMSWQGPIQAQYTMECWEPEMLPMPTSLGNLMTIAIVMLTAQCNLLICKLDEVCAMYWEVASCMSSQGLTVCTTFCYIDDVMQKECSQCHLISELDGELIFGNIVKYYQWPVYPLLSPYAHCIILHGDSCRVLWKL